MITTEKLKIFEKYQGDPDRFTRAKRRERAILTEDVFFEINRLISDLKLIANSVASASYEERIFRQIENLVDNTQSKEYLIKLSKTISCGTGHIAVFNRS